MTNTHIIRLQKSDVERLKQLIALFNVVFEEYHTIASEKHLNTLLAKEDFHAVVAIKDDKIIGGLTAYELQRYYTNKSELYIYDIAVKTDLQNQGIGKELLNHLKDYGRDNNIETIFVEALSEEEDAVKFYQSTIGEREKVDHFNFEIKPHKR